MWMLYAISMNPEVQEKAYQEIAAVMKTDDIITVDHLQKMAYLRNCMKESLRLYTPTPMNIRSLDHDIELSGHVIPANSDIFLANKLACSDPKNWEFDPKLFIPERHNHKHHAFASLSFGMGSRGCLGKRIAETEMLMAMVALLKKFKISYQGKKHPEATMQLFLVPDIPLEISFVPRTPNKD